MVADPSLEPKVPGFTLLGRLGAGAMGTVYRARPDGSEREVALKLLSSDAVSQRRRFKREAEIQRTLDHPNLVRVIDASLDGQSWIAMELVEGGTLAGVIDRLGPLPIGFLAPALLQLASAVAFLHDQQVIHRDLKPGNVMLSDEGVLKITDFGLAYRSGLTALTQRGGMLGTLAYMSPEAVSGGDVGAPSDMYALGLMAYEMATGKLPYQGDGTAAWVAAIMQAPVSPPSALRSEVPRELDALVLALLAKAPGDRLTAAQACQRLAVAASTTGMPSDSMHGAVRKLVADLRNTIGARAPGESWRTVEAEPVAADAEQTQEAPPPARGRASWWVASLALAAALGIIVWQTMKPPARDVAAEGVECARRRAALQAVVPELARRVRATPALSAAIARWSAEHGGREAAEQADAAARKVVAGLRVSEPIAACPARGVFALAGGGLECDAHPGVVAGAPVIAEERPAVELALQTLVIEASPELAGCVERQRHVLDAWIDRSGAVRIPAGLTLADLEREQPSLAFFLHPAGETYALAGGVLECDRHLSVQRVARRTAAFSLSLARP